jgi:hypothetical protein
MVYGRGVSRSCTPLTNIASRFCVTQIIVTLATAERAYEEGYIRVERKEKYVRVDGEWV